MLIPYHSDAPLYHWPFATGGLIVANLFVFFMQMMTGGADWLWMQFVLEHGDGLHPIQWLTSIFIHGGILHLVGNMIFLWAFGMIVEGKVGPFVFLAIYLFTGVGQCAVEQLIYMNGEEGFSIGASSAIYGLVMIAMIWAPQDTMKSILILVIYFVPVDVPVAMFGAIYLAWDFTVALFSGFDVGTALLHLMGAVFGIVIGFLFLFTSRVDCEQHDLVSMILQLGGGKGVTKKKTKREAAQEQADREQRQLDLQRSIEKHWESMHHHLNAGNPAAAADIFPKLKKLDPNQTWREDVLFQIVSQFQNQKKWDQLEHYSMEYIENTFTHRDTVIVNLARVLVVHRERPRRALALLERLNIAALSDKNKLLVRKLAETAQQQIQDGAIEFGD